MATGGGGTGDDGEGDANGETPADLEDAAKGGDTEGGGAVEGEVCYACDTGEAGSLSVKGFVLHLGAGLTRRRIRPLLRPCIPSASEACIFVRRGCEFGGLKNVPAVLEVELPLRHRLSGNNMSGIMLLDSLSGTNFHYFISALCRVFKHVVRLTVIGVQTVEVCHFLIVVLLCYPKYVYIDTSIGEQSNRKQPKGKLEDNKYRLAGSSSPSRIVMLSFCKTPRSNSSS